MNTSLEQYHLERLERESARSRSSTWPLQDGASQPPPPPNNAGCSSSGEPAPSASSGMEVGSPADQQQQGVQGTTIKRETPECESPIPSVASQQSKSSSDSKKMRNAWGNMSYAELITQAILSSPEQKLTLSEIYEWIVKNVPYFSDKASSPSTAGWKNSVRHNLSLHSRFVKVQNDTSGKSSWWTVNLDAKSGRTSRRRSHSVDNTNTSSPKTRKREKRNKLKKVSKGSSSENILSSPIQSPTVIQQLPWSPNPSPTESDPSPCYSPSLQSPIMHRGSRNVTPVSPLISPPGLDQQGAAVFSGSNSSLLDSGTHTPDFGDPNACVDMLAQLNLRPAIEHMGSSSSLSSLNSPRPLPSNTKSPHPPMFSYGNNGTIDSSGYSSSAYFSDTELPDSLPPPPPYEEHLPHQRSACYTPTRSGTHPLHITLSADMARPRSDSEPVVNHSLQHHHDDNLPQDIDMDLIGSEFPGCDVESILRNEMQYENGRLDFNFDMKQVSIAPSSSSSSPPSQGPSSSSTAPSSYTRTPNHVHNTNNNANLRRTTPPHGCLPHSSPSASSPGSTHPHGLQVTAATPPSTHHGHQQLSQHHTYQVHPHLHSLPTVPGDPTLTSTAIQADPLLLQGHSLSHHPAATATTGYWAR